MYYFAVHLPSGAIFAHQGSIEVIKLWLKSLAARELYYKHIDEEIKQKLEFWASTLQDLPAVKLARWDGSKLEYQLHEVKR